MRKNILVTLLFVLCLVGISPAQFAPEESLGQTLCYVGTNGKRKRACCKYLENFRNRNASGKRIWHCYHL